MDINLNSKPPSGSAVCFNNSQVRVCSPGSRPSLIVTALDMILVSPPVLQCPERSSPSNIVGLFPIPIQLYGLLNLFIYPTLRTPLMILIWTQVLYLYFTHTCFKFERYSGAGDIGHKVMFLFPVPFTPYGNLLVRPQKAQITHTYQPLFSTGTSGCFSLFAEKHWGLIVGRTRSLSYFIFICICTESMSFNKIAGIKSGQAHPWDRLNRIKLIDRHWIRSRDTLLVLVHFTYLRIHVGRSYSTHDIMSFPRNLLRTSVTVNFDSLSV